MRPILLFWFILSFIQLFKLTFADSPSLIVEGKNYATQKIQNFDLAKTPKASVLIFLSSRCPCSQSHQSEFNKLAEQYSKKGFLFLGIHPNADEVKESDLTYLQSPLWKFPILKDEELKISNQWGAFKTPHIFIISNKGKVLYMGAASNQRDFSKSTKNYLREVLEDLDKNKPQRHTKTMSVGCMIRR